MDMIAHHHPLAQKIPFGLKSRMQPATNSAISEAPQVTRSPPLVEVALQASPKVGPDSLLRVLCRPTVLRCLLQQPQPFRSLPLKLKTALLGVKPVRETEGDEI